MENRSYRVGCSYKDTASTSNPNDEFLRWINIDQSGMLNSPGIRDLKYVNKISENGVPAYLILVTHDDKKDGVRNPWEDVVDYAAGRIIYWGDAKFHKTKKLHDFRGNKNLEIIWNLILEKKMDWVPPILHFSKPSKGIVKFNGVCVLDKLEITWFSDNSTPVRNYRCTLSILDIDEVFIDWLHSRARATSLEEIDRDAPKAWRDYKKGVLRKIDVWSPKIKTTEQQLPIEGTSDAKILEQLVALTPTQFESVTVALFRQLPEVTHSITQTRPTADGGFDFYGRFTLPSPISYDIHFLGEAKKFQRSTAVQPKHVSRLVARLQRGQYGIFVTTSYYTKQTQKEVLEDGYPIKLFSGMDIILFLKELNLVYKDRVSEEWLQGVFQNYSVASTNDANTNTFYQEELREQ